MPKLKQPSHKQRKFISEYISNGFNGQLAATNSYNCSNSNSAKAIASENLTKPYIKSAIATELELLPEEVRKKLTPEWILTQLQSIATTSRKDADRIRALELIGDTRLVSLFDKRQVIETISRTESMPESAIDAEYRSLIARRSKDAITIPADAKADAKADAR